MVISSFIGVSGLIFASLVVRKKLNEEMIKLKTIKSEE